MQILLGIYFKLLLCLKIHARLDRVRETLCIDTNTYIHKHFFGAFIFHQDRILSDDKGRIIDYFNRFFSRAVKKV